MGNENGQAAGVTTPTAEQMAIILQEIGKGGYEELWALMREAVIHNVRARLAVYGAEIGVYEKKYEMSYDAFAASAAALTGFGIFEKEDDDMGWETKLSQKEYCAGLLNLLENERSNQGI